MYSFMVVCLARGLSLFILYAASVVAVEVCMELSHTNLHSDNTCSIQDKQYQIQAYHMTMQYSIETV